MENPAPWDAEGMFPLKPDGPDYGYFNRGRVFACSREDLVRVCTQSRSEVLLVWTPASSHFVTAWEVPWLEEALRERSRFWLRQRAQVSGLILFLLGGLAATTWNSREFPVYAAVAVFMGLIPLIWAWRTHAQLKNRTFNAAETARQTRFKFWTQRRPRRSPWILAGLLALAGAWQVVAGLHRSLEFAGHLKALVFKGEPWRLLTGGLVHAGLLHFGLNVLALVTLGKVVEALTSRWHVFLVFLASILTGSLASQFLNQASNSVGASGGIVGLLGFLAVFAMKRPGVLPSAIRNWIALMILGVVVLGVAAPRMIDNAGHGGGFIGGALLGWILLSRTKAGMPIPAGQGLRALGAASVAIVAAATLALPLTTTSTRLYSNLVLISAMIAEKEPEYAEKTAQRAIRLRPEDPRGYEARGMARNLLGDHAGALEDLSKALSINPDSTTALVHRSFARRNLGDAKGALADSEEAIKRDSRNRGAAEARILALEDLGMIEDALKDLDRAIEARSPESDLHVWRAWLLIRLDRFDEAVKECDKALVLKPDDAHAVNNRGLAKAGKGDLDGAIVDYSEAIRRDPEHPFALSNRGDAKLLKGDRDGALEDYGAALKRDPQDEDALYGRGRVKRQSGDVRGARADIAEALKVALPTWYRRAEAEAALREVTGP